MISSQDIKRRSFSKTIKGYTPSEVDEYISYLLSKYNEVCNEYTELEKKYNVTLDKLEMAKSEENTISATIVNAQKMADAIIADAKAKADEIRSAVSGACDRIVDVYLEKVKSERDKLAKLEQTAASFKASLYEAYKEHIAVIDNIMPDQEPTPYLSDEELESKAVELAKEQMRNDDNSSDIEVFSEEYGDNILAE